MTTSVTGYTAAKMDELANENIVDGNIVGDNLILVKRDLTTVDAGNVRGPAGLAGATSIVICTSGTRPTGGALFEGLQIYETDTDSRWVYSGSAWLYIGPNIPHKKLARVDFASSGTISSVTYADLPSALSIANFIKYRPDSTLVVKCTGTLGVDLSTSGAEISVNIGGTLTLLTAVLASGTDGAYDSHSFVGSAQITGLAAATIALIKIQWKVYTGSMTAVQTGTWILEVEEVML